MIALDTNVVVRFLVNDDPAQARRARSLIEATETFVPASVLLEAEWVLRAAYGLGRVEVGRLLRGLLGLEKLATEEPQRIARALEWHARGLDFADALHLASCAGAERFATFDEKLVKSARKIVPGTVVAA